MLFLLLALRAFPFVEFPLETPEPGELRDGDFVAGGAWEENTVFTRCFLQNLRNPFTPMARILTSETGCV